MEELKNARRDFLTNFYMKQELDPILMKVKAECKIYKRPFSILVLDLDHFKSYNDKYGHFEGDEVLKYFSSTIRLSLDEGECVPFRFGGDEFIIVFPGKNASEAHIVAEELRKSLRKRPFLLRGRIFKMSFSGGIVSYPHDGNEVEDLLDKADKAMYYSKTHGRGRTTQYSMMWIATFKRIAFFILIGLMILSAVFYGVFIAKGDFKEKIIDKIKGIRGVNVTMSQAPIQIVVDESVTVYMKSGGIFKGVVIGEDKDTIELKLRLDRGEGAVFLKKSDIRLIDKGPVRK